MSRWQVWEACGDRVVCARPGHDTEAVALDRLPLDCPAVVTRDGEVVCATPRTSDTVRAALAAYARCHWIRLTPIALRPRCTRCTTRTQTPPAHDAAPWEYGLCDQCVGTVESQCARPPARPMCARRWSSGSLCERRSVPLRAGDPPSLVGYCRRCRDRLWTRAERIDL